MKYRLISIFRFLFRRPELERDLDAELRFHADHLTEQNIAKGMSASQARRQAVIAVGGIEGTKEGCRDARTGRWIETFFQDVRYGGRVLRKNPGFALSAMIVLALGIGANTAIFSVVYGVLLRPLPYAQGGELVVLHQNAPGAHVFDIPFSVKEIADYRERSHTLAGVVEHHSMNFLLIGKDSAQRVDTAVVSANFFDVLGVRPLLGRTFVASDEIKGTNAVLVLSYKYWQTRQNGDPNIVGKVFEMNNRPHTVIGVLPAIPQYPQESDVYMPTSQCPARSSANFIASRSSRMMTAFARLKPGVTLEQAQADLSVVATQMVSANPDVYLKQEGYALVAAPLRDDLTRRARTMFLVLLGVAGFVLLIACANVANLLLARLLKLERELAVRAALGASRMRLVRQVLTESVLLSTLGGLLGLALTPLALKLLVRFAQNFTQRASEVHLDAPVLLFTVAISIATGVVFGAAPVLFWGGWSDGAFHPGGTWSTTSAGRKRARSALVIAQVAVSVVLLAGAALMLRSFARLQQIDSGFDAQRLLTMRLSPGFPPYTVKTSRVLAERILEKIKTVPGVESTALASSFPFNPAGLVNGPNSDQYEIEGRPVSKGDALPNLDGRVTSADYFQTLRQPILRGRAWSAHDERGDAPGVLVINEAMARHHFPNEDPVGKRMRFNSGGGSWTPWFQIVGVAGDVKEYGLDRPVADEAYAVYQDGWVPRLLVRTARDPISMEKALRGAIHEVDPLVAIDQVNTVEHAQYDSMTSQRVMTFLLALFAVLAVVISCFGIASVMALAVRQRTREIGVRMALGAQAGSIVTMLLREGLTLAAAGTLLGIAGASALTRLLAAFLYGTSPTDVLTFISVTLIFLAVALLACFIPARLVASIDPLISLRQE
jgi:putative ABC transport system permease protein